MQKSGQRKKSKNMSAFRTGYVQHVKQVVRSKVNSLRKTVEPKRQRIVELNYVTECSKELQQKFVFVPANKAADSIIMVCKRYYLGVIWKELGLWLGVRWLGGGGGGVSVKDA